MSWTRSNWALLVIVHTQVLQSISLQIYTFARVGIWFPRLGFAIGVRKESARQNSAGGTTTAVTTAVTTTFELVNIKSSKKQKWTKTNDRLLIIALLSPGELLIARKLCFFFFTSTRHSGVANICDTIRDFQANLLNIKLASNWSIIFDLTDPKFSYDRISPLLNDKKKWKENNGNIGEIYC